MQNRRGYKLSEARIKIKNYCANQERCQWDVRKKFNEWGLAENIKDILMTELIDEQFIDEERYARSFCRGKFKIKKWGKRKIEFELKKKKISTLYIRKGMEEINEKVYLLHLTTQAEKKQNLMKDKSHIVRRRKLAKYLIDKGYESDLVWEKIREIYSR